MTITAVTILALNDVRTSERLGAIGSNLGHVAEDVNNLCDRDPQLAPELVTVAQCLVQAVEALASAQTVVSLRFDLALAELLS